MTLPPEISIRVVSYISAPSIVSAFQFPKERDGITTRGLGREHRTVLKSS
jgi:hypothetical protein